MARPTTKAARDAQAAAPLVCVGGCGATNPERIQGRNKWRCSDCAPVRRREAVDRHRERNREETNLKSNHKGLTVAEYKRRVAEQGGRCSGCGRVADLHVDHDHASGCDHTHRKSCPNCRRGLLCGPCNRALGMAGDSVETLLSLAAYLVGWERSPDK